MNRNRRRTGASLAVIALAVAAFIAGRMADVSMREPIAVIVMCVLVAAFLTTMLLM